MLTSKLLIFTFICLWPPSVYPLLTPRSMHADRVHANAYMVRMIRSVAPSKMQESSATRSIGWKKRGDKKKAEKAGVADQVLGVKGRGEDAICHCEEPGDEAISILGVVDCFASLAMT